MDQSKTNEQRIFDYMEDKRYQWTLAFYPDTSDKSQSAQDALPNLDWKIKKLLIHPCGFTSTSHWRLSLLSENDKRIFFNNSADYLYYGYGQVRVGPGNDANDNVAFELALTGHEHTLEDFLKAALHPKLIPGDYDGIHEDEPMSWFNYAGYATKGNRECRHWVQAVARQFWKQGLAAADPTDEFAVKNKAYGYPDGDIPKGLFYKNKLEVWNENVKS